MRDQELMTCLKDCGVKAGGRDAILLCAQNGQTDRALQLLCRERAGLLEDLHRAQRHIDLMDLLIQSLKKPVNKEDDR